MVTKTNRIHPNRCIDELKKKNKNIGEYLDDECRDAIAHIRRSPMSKTHIDPNSWDDYCRIAVSANLLRDLVRLYVVDELKLNEEQYLHKRKVRDIPEYLTKDDLLRSRCGFGMEIIKR